MKYYYGDGTKVPKEIALLLKNTPTRSYPENDFYKKLKAEAIAEKGDKLNVVSYMMNHHLDYLRYSSDTTELQLGGVYLRFTSRAQSIDVTRVQVDDEYQGKGLGTLMMKVFMELLIQTMAKHKIFTLPKVVLECSGSCGAGKNQVFNDLDKQVSFFQKFGFEVVREKDGYTHLQLTENGFVDYFQKRNIESNLVEQK